PPMPSRPASRPAARPSSGKPRYIHGDTVRLRSMRDRGRGACGRVVTAIQARWVYSSACRPPPPPPPPRARPPPAPPPTPPPRPGHSGAIVIFERMSRPPTPPLALSVSPTSPRPRHHAPYRLARWLALLAFVSCAVQAQALQDASADAAVRSAIEAAQRGQPFAASAALRADPRWPWIEYARIARDLDRADPAEVRAFLQRYDGQPVATTLRPQWLASLARRRQWADLLAD